MSLTAHQRIELRRRFPEAALSCDERAQRIALVFPDRSQAFGYFVVGKWYVSIGGQFAGVASLDRVLEARDTLREMLR